MSDVLFIGGPWNRTIRPVNNSGDLIANVDGNEVFYRAGEHGMDSGLSYLVAFSPDADIQETPAAIRDTRHRPFVRD